MEYIEIINQLANNKDIINDLLKNIPQDHAAWRKSDNRWTILEIVNHLIDIEKEDFRYEIKLILENPQSSWPNFSIEQWRIDRNYNDRNYLQSVNEFLMERNRSLNWLKSLKNLDFYAEHSGNGFKDNTKMKIGDVLVSWIGHDLFHIQQITLAKWFLLNYMAKPFSPEYSGFSEKKLNPN